jgi:hypothetical protein
MRYCLCWRARSSGSLLATGDKRCIRAVARSAPYLPVFNALSGRVLCLEQVLLRAAAILGFDVLKHRLVGSGQLTLDTAVRAAFGSGVAADEQNAVWALERRARILAAEAGGLLASQVYRFDESGT